MIKRMIYLTLLASVVSGTGVSAYAADSAKEPPGRVVFVCLHGIAKSQMAAAYFNRIAKERGLPFIAVSRGVAAEDKIPAGVRDGLAVDGLGAADPRNLTADEASRAVKVFAFDPVPEDQRGGAEVAYWSDVPMVSKDYRAARDVIIRHVSDAITSLPSSR